MLLCGCNVEYRDSVCVALGCPRPSLVVPSSLVSCLLRNTWVGSVRNHLRCMRWSRHLCFFTSRSMMVPSVWLSWWDWHGAGWCSLGSMLVWIEIWTLANLSSHSCWARICAVFKGVVWWLRGESGIQPLIQCPALLVPCGASKRTCAEVRDVHVSITYCISFDHECLHVQSHRTASRIICFRMFLHTVRC